MGRSLSIRWLRAAVRNLDEIAAEISRDSPRAAAATVSRIVADVAKLERFPEMGRIGRVESTRELVISSTPYIVAYRVRSKSIEVLRVLHGAMRWPGRL